MATLPSGGIQRVRVRDERRQAETVSPFTGARKVYDWGARKYRVWVTTRPYKLGDAAIQTWLDFFEDCEGMVDTFTMNLSAYLPGRSGVSSVTLRMAGPHKEHTVPKNKVVSFEFEAVSE